MHSNMQGRVWHSMKHLVLWVYCCHITHIIYSHFRKSLGRHASDMAHSKHVILFVNITSFNDAVMSYVMSQCHTCIGHMTIYYKRAANTLVGGSCLQFVSSLGLTLSPKTLVWLVSNTCRSRHIKCISGWEPTSFNSNYCVSLG